MKTKLQALRKAAGFGSSDAFADHLGMNRSTYKNYEQGTRKISLDNACFFADALDCTLDELAGRTPPNVDAEAAEFARRFEALPRPGRRAVIDILEFQEYKSKSERMQNNRISVA